MLGLVCIDVDGTLVGNQNQVHPKVWDKAQEVLAAGLPLAICTGRPAMSSTRAYAEKLNPQGWHIFQGGASLYHVGSGQSHSHPLSQAALEHLLKLYQTHGWVLELYSDQDYVVESFPAGSEADHLARSHAQLIEVPFAPRSLDSLQGTLVRAQWVVSDPQLSAAMASSFEGVLYSSATSPSVPGSHFISVTSAGVDKCSAIRELAKLLNVSLENTMMIGDGQNDIRAMELVGHSVAMENADPRLKAVCRYQVGHVDRGGVAEALELALNLN
ncbi:Cof-type HAD-IIB family hydrolase [bacterium (Candidatus Blackallbacteria) CG17_big_fil_post_rev_8_21_14_2_50_48_46]|uniref:Cof-type HAD-IIB family hydrolase n=1 Tax=bacterium (Candidatus Blackallbacteria) CG17_big_fil_post_rev_8_21_14_2_50_48_46 TaxID=2014261 RepID=A0A2M7G074_9BACT|nr:MAG: Cof protein [bacterium (Candidatus Blackallbacteria) CG18_big_fil_WC_8_21_14_2_50_49_26]PIW14589.1 MAG: Cof-type HAD-IIB family hydrolase [bacterium (Candidatus Blackallbacteria) CG17_big_fil_post_rev_8_21_14_2_50_48_46]PIW45640.1 MAG: Cof-type HAD-IIB family hydrolase [bacterium (Candidatus Blackallbacteria) CG13_big_fil_rev_8_21_14_2_50_49_14]